MATEHSAFLMDLLGQITPSKKFSCHHCQKTLEYMQITLCDKEREEQFCDTCPMRITCYLEIKP